MVNHVIKISRYVVIATFMLFLGNSCSYRESENTKVEDVSSDGREQIVKDLPVGTISSEVEAYFKKRRIPFHFESSKELDELHTLEVLEPEEGGLRSADVSGLYSSVIHDAGKVFLLGKYSLLVYVYIGHDDKVIKADVRARYSFL